MSLVKAYKHKLPNFGPVSVDNITEFLKKEKRKFYLRFNAPFPFVTRLENFVFLHVLAKGSYGKLILAREKLEPSSYAVKIVKKKLLVRKNEVKEALIEKKILQSLNCPFCVRLEFFYQDNSYIYLFMPFGSAGDLFTKLQKDQRFEESLARFYLAQVVLALEYLHHMDLIYRDLKPENILLDYSGYLKLTDFGFTKVVETRTYSFCGTLDYISPEMIKGHGYGRAVDWWALGVLAFEMISGYPPFLSKHSVERFNKILLAKFTMPSFVRGSVLDFVQGLMQVDVTRRLGNLRGGAEDIKQHAWMRTVDWYSLFNRRVTPPYVPPDVEISPDIFPKLKKLKGLRVSDVDHYPGMFDEF